MSFGKRTPPDFSVLLTLAILGGIMLNLSWAPHSFTFLAFFSLVPFLIVANNFNQKPAKVFVALFSGFFTFHATAAWWMYSSTLAGSLMAHWLNALLPAATLAIWGAFSEKPSNPFGKGVLLIALWISMEWLNAVWPLAWPWFQLGHVFGARPQWVQWYSLTSSAGGTVWVLVINYLLFNLAVQLHKINAFSLALVAITIALPVAISQNYARPVSTDKTVSLAIVQPNIHPQREKFGGMDAQDQLFKATSLLNGLAPGTIDYAIFPETMLVEPIDEALFDEDPFIGHLRQKMTELNLKGIFTGAFTKRNSGWHESDEGRIIDGEQPHILYNSMLFITDKDVKVYHKEKLVPLVEKQPFLWLLRPLKQFVERSGGFFGSYGVHNEQNYFLLDTNAKAVPLICFESAFACHPTTHQSSSFMILITNDGWWSSSGGYIQHLNLSRLRAIERRQWVARSANTGVSGLISPNGHLVNSIDYGHQGLIISKLNLTYDADWACRGLRLMRWMAISILLIFALLASKKQFNS